MVCFRSLETSMNILAALRAFIAVTLVSSAVHAPPQIAEVPSLISRFGLGNTDPSIP